MFILKQNERYSSAAPLIRFAKRKVDLRTKSVNNLPMLNDGIGGNPNGIICRSSWWVLGLWLPSVMAF